MFRKAVTSTARTVALCSLLIGCDSGVLWEDERYVVWWIDIGDNVTLDYKLTEPALGFWLGGGTSIQRVPPRILAVGSNEFYVAAQQISLSTGEILYYYVDKKKDSRYYNAKDITVGPLTEEEYKSQKIKLSLPELTIL
jgi:hypothetical protein